MATMDDLVERKVFVHCAADVRVSAFIFLYRVIRHGLPVGFARGFVRRICEPNAVWREFVDKCLARYAVPDGWG